jgi:hypothetical protein
MRVRSSAGLSIAAICGLNLVLGWSSGYDSAVPYLAFWILAALPLLAAYRLVARIWPSLDRTDQAVRQALVVLAIVVGCGLVLGALRILTLWAYLCAEAALLGIAYVATAGPAPARDQPQASGERSLPGSLLVGVAGAMLAFAIAFAISHAPLTLYDSLSYHLFFPARWLQEHALSIVPTPFSDEAQAYAPANGELFFLWLMLPFHGDLLARFGQMPFVLLAAATLYLMARRLGASRQGAIYPAAFLLLARPVLEQTVGADVDLICAALFLLSLHLGIAAIDQNHRRDWALWGVALGLYAGTKYLALVYAPIFVLLAMVRGPRWNVLWTLPGLLVFGAPWYARNWIVAGSPLYPASLTLGGLTLARGAFDRSAMLNTVFHTSDVGFLPAILAHGLGPTLFLVWVPMALLGAVMMLRRGWWPAGFVCAVPVAVVALCWFGVPVNVDSRFLMPAVAPALLPLAFVVDSRVRGWNVAAHAFLLGSAAWIVIGRPTEIPAALPWFMKDWLSLIGLVPPPYLLSFGALTAGLAAAWYWRPRDSRWLAPFAACFVAVPVTLLIVHAARSCPGAQCEYLSTSSPYIREDSINGWQWLTNHVSGSIVAYTGNNLPYPLTGDRLTNRVVYVNIDGRPRWKFHDYARAFRSGRFSPEPPLLATSSGELLPVAKRDGPSNALRPRFERMQGIREAWIDNLRRQNVDCLFVAVLSPYEINYVWHDDRGFPIEQTWADGDPRMFHLLYGNSNVRVYGIDRVPGGGA